MCISIFYKKLSDEKLKDVWEAEWGGKIFCSHRTKHSKGVMILFNPKYDIEVEKLKRDNHGRLIILNTKMNDTNLVLINLYAPSDLSQQVQFFDRITDKFSNYADESIIIGGDFNCSLTHLDKVGGKPVENKKCVIDKISNLINLYSMHDVWREKNPNENNLLGETKHLKFNVD